MPRISPVWFVLLITLSSQSPAASPFSLHADPTDSSDGTVTLSWSAADGEQVYIERGIDAGFVHPVVIYRGTDSASVITGLTDGRYFFRGRLERDGTPLSDWSKPVSVTVTHHSLNRALLFFALGAVVFLATLLLVIYGARREKISQ